MRKPIVPGAIAAALVFAGVWYFASRDGGLTTVHPPPANAGPDDVAAATATAPAAHAPAQEGAVSSDPRFQALMVSPDNGLIEFVKDADGRVIREIDNDPSSARYRKSSREYTYLGYRVVGLTTYRHLGQQIQVTRIMVAYRPDGGIEKFIETTDYEPAQTAR